MNDEKLHKPRFLTVRLLWACVVLLLLAATAYSAFDLYKSLAAEGEKAIDTGKRAIVEIATGKIIVAQSLDEKQQIEKAKQEAEEAAKEAAQKAAEEAKKHKEQEAEAAKKAAEEAAKKAVNANTLVELPALTPSVFTGKIAIMVTGLGVNMQWSDAALQLVTPVQLSLSPYTSAIATLGSSIKARNTPVLIDLPTATKDYPYTDPGPYALFADATEDQNMLRLQTLLNLTSDIKGIVLLPNESITGNQDVFIPIMDYLARQKRWIIYRTNEKNQYVAEQASALGIPHLSDYLLLDEQTSEEGLMEQMQIVYAHINANKGNLLVAARPYPGSLAMLTRLINDMKTAGYTPASIDSLFTK